MIAAAAIFLLTFCAMEGVANLAHRFLMHGPLWVLHRDHHQTPPRRPQRNDLFFVIFAAPSACSIYLGMLHGWPQLVAVGLGIAAYGFAYVVVHELIIHQRLTFLRHSQNAYVRLVRHAHRMHHKHLGREDGESFGMLWVERRYREKLGP